MDMVFLPMVKPQLGRLSSSTTIYPPQICFHSENILTLGIIPGPKKPRNIDSFLTPLTDELFQLASGVEAYDVLTESTFNLHAFLLVFGDFLAVSMLMKMKGVNALSPC